MTLAKKNWWTSAESSFAIILDSTYSAALATAVWTSAGAATVWRAARWAPVTPGGRSPAATTYEAVESERLA